MIAQTTGCPDKGLHINGTETSCRSTTLPFLASSTTLTMSQVYLLCSSEPKVFTNIVSVCSGCSCSNSLRRFVIYDRWLPLSRMALICVDKPELRGLLALAFAVCSKIGIFVDTYMDSPGACGVGSVVGTVDLTGARGDWEGFAKKNSMPKSLTS